MRELLDRWVAHAPAGYADVAPPAVAAADFTALNELDTDGTEALMRLRRHVGREPAWRLVVYHRGQQVPVSTFLPAVESFGFTVVDHAALRLPDVLLPQRTVQVHDLGVTHACLPASDDDGVCGGAPAGDRLSSALAAAWQGAGDVDGLNQLVLAAGLTGSEVAVLRAYRRYRRQVGTAFTADYLDRALTAHPHVATALLEHFTARLRPVGSPTADDEREPAGARDRVVRLIDTVEDLDADRILRDLLALVDATVRTNSWTAGAADALALKFVPSHVPEMPDPVPHREIFVSAPTVEGVHLRGGPVARGGLRWSTRRQDYRTEILSLLKAQLVKNAVIVPTGAKGGFVLRADTEPTQAAVERAYRTFVSALLDVTDNVLPDGSVQTPAGVRALDGPDAYLVVAADRGTATFSDVANSIAVERGFWLGDAFASGGRTGYDHKRLGVTARGAWEAARGHFAQLGVDPERDPVTAVGIGDMSGDVFGNGMLRSRTLRLIAAFDHRHVFLDPTPDTDVGYAERQRLFALPRSSWDDYDRGRISAGGGVWARGDKRIPVSEPARRALGLAEDVRELSGPELVSAVLRGPVDLLYAGGVGTYVKASREPHAAAQDRANDAVRVDADELRARVVVEGANLALTQAARVEYATANGAVNTDAVDNAAGVDTSDHEVNLKVLLALPVADGVLNRQQRDQLLAGQADWVVADVLQHMRSQTAALTRETAASARRLTSYADLLAGLESPAAWPRIDRARDALPSAQDLDRLARQRAGLTRPQLAVLTGMVKSNLRRELTDAALQDREPFHTVLCGYFPDPVHREFGRWLHDRRISSELAAAVVACRLANDVVERMGLTWVHEAAADLGVEQARVVQAYWAAKLVLQADGVWERLTGLPDGIDPDAAATAHEAVRRAVGESARRYAARPEFDAAATVAADSEVVEQLVTSLDVRDALGDRRRARTDWLVAHGLDSDTAARAAAVELLGATADVASAARATGQPPGLTAAVFAEIDEALRLSELEEALRRHQATAQSWERREVQGLRGDWRQLRADCAAGVLAQLDSCPADGAVRRWLEARAAASPVLGASVGAVEVSALPVAGLGVHLRRLRHLLDDPMGSLGGVS